MKGYDIKIHIDVEGGIDIDIRKEGTDVDLNAGVSSIEAALEFWKTIGDFMTGLKLETPLDFTDRP